ncbi:Terminase-like family protein [Planctomycetes bacterium Pan216]|uniref:Terminase-like family protein n=2 Tax=Kolteria novifilia TaxID=2527975 RepID=A0A518AZ54_9BACT|nr:Terminase-like family protein [Planctomycetes bacterium Pan216]
MTDYIVHRPTTKQAAFLLLSGLEALFGGAAGGGKSDALLMAALQYVDHPGYAAVLFRRTLADLALPGALIDRAHQWLAGTDAKWNQSDKTWTFPSGSTLSFGYLDHPRDRYRYQSSEFQYIGFDELTQFRETDYTYLFSRLRRLQGAFVPLRIRAATNPGGLGHDWVRQRFLLDPRPPERVFLSATLMDNPHLERESYLESLGQLDPLSRSHLLDGDWSADEEGILRFEDIIACQTETLWNKEGPKQRERPELYLGVDVGRTRDLTVIWTWQRMGDVCWCRDLTVLAGASFGEQRDAISKRLTRHVVACAIDKGGIGYQLAEELEASHPGVVEGVVLSAGVQGRLARRLAVAFAERLVRIPDDPVLRDDLRQVKRTRIVGGVDRVETERSASGHADRFWAAALGYDAACVHATSPPRPKASLPRTARTKKNARCSRTRKRRRAQS